MLGRRLCDQSQLDVTVPTPTALEGLCACVCLRECAHVNVGVSTHTCAHRSVSTYSPAAAWCLGPRAGSVAATCRRARGVASVSPLGRCWCDLEGTEPQDGQGWSPGPPPAGAAWTSRAWREGGEGHSPRRAQASGDPGGEPVLLGIREKTPGRAGPHGGPKQSDLLSLCRVAGECGWSARRRTAACPGPRSMRSPGPAAWPVSAHLVARGLQPPGPAGPAFPPQRSRGSGGSRRRPCADMEASEGAWFLDRLVTQEGRLTTLVQPQPCLVTGAGDPYLRGDDEHRPPRRPGHLTDPPSLPATAGLSRALSPPVPVTCRPSAPPETDPPAGGHKALPSPSSSCRLLCLSPPSPGPQGPQFRAKRAAAPRAAGQS